MNLLLDTCVWGGALPILRAAGHDVVWSGEWAVVLGRRFVTTGRAEMSGSGLQAPTRWGLFPVETPAGLAIWIGNQSVIQLQ